MSALPPEADMLIVGINVCYVPIADNRPIRHAVRFGDLSRVVSEVVVEDRRVPGDDEVLDRRDVEP